MKNARILSSSLLKNSKLISNRGILSSSFVRPFSFQSWPNELLPDELKNENPLGILRTVNGVATKQNL